MSFQNLKKTFKRSLKTYLQEFEAVTGLLPRLDSEYTAQAERLVDFVNKRQLRSLAQRRRDFLGRLNWKFRLNRDPIACFYAVAAKNGTTFHFHEKQRIEGAFNFQRREALTAVLETRTEGTILQTLQALYDPISDAVSVNHLKSECEKPSKLRKAKGNRDVEGEILCAQFASFLWASLPEREMHQFFDPLFDDERYCSSFWEELHLRSPDLFSRENALQVVRLTAERLGRFGSSDRLRQALSSLVSTLYDRCDNYGFLAIMVEPFDQGGGAKEWEVAADLMLFAEKHIEYPLNKAYFRWQRVRDETLEHVDAKPDEARFDLVNEGFTYRDCFVLEKAKQRPALLLLFQKNHRDETVVPCPACRSPTVQGNSYPALGVRSWECRNTICPDRSKYNRGKRYSFKGLLMQEAIEHIDNEIPRESVQRWLRDVVPSATDAEIFDMLVRHYSMAGDGVHVYGWPTFSDSTSSRTVEFHDLGFPKRSESFWDGPLFSRYVADARTVPTTGKHLGDDTFRVVNGDAASVLASFEEATFDGAVTSPPYYNAREYAQWPNMYCYLHDMFAINAQVFRVLKPGALYYYNIFDYFDNERTVVFSAMGNKRLVLSAYTVDLFRRIGFQVVGNVVWDKGDIEGKRGFNGGNYSPFYQAPFNCWEHTLVFQKPGPSTPRPVGEILRAKPVFKMVRGKNVHGHSAPFPEAIPELLTRHLSPGAMVLDPFGGSMTTGRVAERHGLRSVCVERSEEYCKLGLQLRADATKRRPRTSSN